MKKLVKNPLFILVTLLMVAVTLVDIVEKDRDFSAAENKYLTQFPSVSWKSIVDGSFESNYETYIADQFFMRDTWINIKSVSESALQKTENNGIAYGKDGYLFSKFISYDSKVLENNMNAISTFSKNAGQNVHLMIIPSGYAVMDSKVPAGFPAIEQDPLIDKAVSLAGSNVSYIDTLSLLRDHSEENIYYMTDHHWTTYGAYLGYTEFCKTLNVSPFSYDDLSIRSVPDFLGTSYYKCKKFNQVRDTIDYADIKAVCDIDGDIKQSLYDESMLSERDKYAMFLWNNNARMDITSSECSNGKNILIIKDSFANELIPFLCFNYEKITVIDPRYYAQSYTDLLAEGWDDILVLYNIETLCTNTNVVKIGF